MGREDGAIFSCCFILSTSTTVCALGPAVSGKANRGSDALKQNEQLFHTWSDSLCNAEEQVNTLLCSRGKPFILTHSFSGFLCIGCVSSVTVCQGSAAPPLLVRVDCAQDETNT